MEINEKIDTSPTGLGGNFIDRLIDSAVEEHEHLSEEERRVIRQDKLDLERAQDETDLRKSEEMEK